MSITQWFYFLAGQMETTISQTKGAFSYELVRDGEETILKIDCDRCNFLPSIEESSLVMSKTIELLVENRAVTKIVFYQQRDYEYGYNQVQLLLEIAKIYDLLVRQKNLLSYQAMGFTPSYTQGFNQRYSELHNIIYNILKSDPLGTYVELKRIIRREKIALEGEADEIYIKNINKYVSLLNYVLDMLEKTRLVSIAKPYLAGYVLGDRTIYRKVFSPIIKPDFMFTRLMATYPRDAEELDTYTVGNTGITIFKLPNSIQYLYHMIPPEFKLSEEKYEILDMARNIIAEHKPKKSEFVDPERMRQVFFNVGRDLVEELINYRNIKLRTKEIEELTEILVRYTVGFGLIEVLLQDEKIQDITINSPMGRIPIFVVHQEFDDCRTNIIPSRSESESWASKLRMISGRPLDEANPILDTELQLPDSRSRVSMITPRRSSKGMTFGKAWPGRLQSG